MEARYQRAAFRGSEEVLMEDFELRYGSRWRELYEAAAGAGEEDVERAEKAAEELAELVAARIDDEGLAAAYAKYARDLTVEPQLEMGLELLGAGPVESLLRWGLAMHFEDDVVAAPAYLARLIARYMAKGLGVELDVAGELEAQLHDRGLLALLEAELAGDADWGVYELVYGRAPASRVRAGRLAVYDPEHGVVVNPATSSEEVLSALLRLKERLAKSMYARLGLHGEYEFDERARCGVAYLSLDGTAEGSAEVYLCPWAAPPRMRGINRVFAVWGDAPAGFRRQRSDMYVFVVEDKAVAVYPERRRPVHEHIVDLLYRSGFEVVEV